MRAMILLVLLLALLALFSLHEPILPFWKDRFPAVMTCLDEGRYRDALDAALAPDPPGEKSERWAKSEPLGEASPQGGTAPGREPELPEGAASGPGPVRQDDAASGPGPVRQDSAESGPGQARRDDLPREPGSNR